MDLAGGFWEPKSTLRKVEKYSSRLLYYSRADDFRNAIHIFVFAFSYCEFHDVNDKDTSNSSFTYSFFKNLNNPFSKAVNLFPSTLGALLQEKKYVHLCFIYTIHFLKCISGFSGCKKTIHISLIDCFKLHICATTFTNTTVQFIGTQW